MTHVLERGLWVAQADETKPVQSYPQTPSNPHHPLGVTFPDRSAPFPVLACAFPVPASPNSLFVLNREVAANPVHHRRLSG